MDPQSIVFLVLMVLMGGVIAYLADRLSARFGEHRVQRFVPQDTHIPEAQSVAVPAQTGSPWLSTTKTPVSSNCG